MVRHWCLLPMHYARALMRDLLQGLSHLHEHGLAHRDIKPENILVDWPGTGTYARLADWGWARDMKKGTGAPATSLTPGAVTLPYRAPEIELGMRSYGLAVDLWSVGILLYELLIGVQFAPQAHISNRAKDKLLFWISRLVGPISEESWPGVSKFQHWKAHAQVLAAAAKAQESLWETSRRAVCLSGRALADAFLQQQPSHRVEAKQALKYAFCSGGDPVLAALCTGGAPAAAALAPVATATATVSTGTQTMAATGSQTMAASGAANGSAQPSDGDAAASGAAPASLERGSGIAVSSTGAPAVETASGHAQHEGGNDVDKQVEPPPVPEAVSSPPLIRLRRKFTLGCSEHKRENRHL